MMINCTAPIPSNPSMYAGDVSVAILIIILILLTIYKVCGVWQNILNFKQVLNTSIAVTYLHVKVLHVIVSGTKQRLIRHHGKKQEAIRRCYFVSVGDKMKYKFSRLDSSFQIWRHWIKKPYHPNPAELLSNPNRNNLNENKKLQKPIYIFIKWLTPNLVFRIMLWTQP